MTKLILIVVAVVAIVWILRRALAGPRPHGGGPHEPPAQTDEMKGELVACAQCAVNLPKSEARSGGGRFYCSDEHLRLGPRDA
jgi:uncharacterized protein